MNGEGTYLGVEELLVGLELWGKTLVGISEVLGLIAESLLEALINISLDVVLVVLGLSLLELSQVVTHVLVQALFLSVDVHLHRLVVPLPLVVVSLNLTEAIAKRSETLDLWGQLLLLFLDLNVDFLDERSEFLHRLRLGVVQLLLHLGDALDLLFNIREAAHTFLLLQSLEDLLDIACLIRKDVLGPLKRGDLSLDFVQNFALLLVLVVLDAEVGSVLAEIVTLHVLGSLLLLVLLFFVPELFLQS